MAVTSEPPTAPRSRRPRATRGQRILRWVGIALIVAGLSLLGWFLWQYFGTNIVSKQAHAQIKKDTVAQWDKGIDGDAVALLRVDRFGADYEVPIVKGWDDAALADGVGMYDEAELPGEKGNFAIAGHRVTHGEPFRDFLDLREGDQIEIETRTHIYTYELQNSGSELTMDFTVKWPTFDVPDPDWDGTPPTESKLTMLTCSELFHTRDRNVVIGDLVETTEKETN